MNELNTQRLRADLDEIAGLSTPVDLHERVLKGSRMATMRRTAIASVAAVAALSSMGAVAVAMAHNRTDAIQPTNPKPQVTSPDPTPADSPSPSPSPTTSATTPPPSLGKAAMRIGTWRTTPANSLPGKLLYTSSDDAGHVQLHVLTAGKLRSAPLIGAEVGTCRQQSIEFSPDGTSVSWVEGDENAIDGNVVVASLTSARRTVVAKRASCAGGEVPKWTPDSRGLIVAPAHGATALLVDVATGKTTPKPKAWRDYIVWSAGGNYLAYHDGTKLVVKTAADGKVVRQVAYELRDEFSDGTLVASVSTDGRYVGVNSKGTDPSQIRGAVRIVDMATGKEVALPRVKPAAVAPSVQLISGGQMLLASRPKNGAWTLHLLNKDKVVVKSVPLPRYSYPGVYLP